MEFLPRGIEWWLIAQALHFAPAQCPFLLFSKTDGSVLPLPDVLVDTRRDQMAARKRLVDQAKLADSGMARHKTSLSVWLGKLERALLSAGRVGLSVLTTVRNKRQIGIVLACKEPTTE
jgi:hypothetical protein